MNGNKNEHPSFGEIIEPLVGREKKPSPLIKLIARYVRENGPAPKDEIIEAYSPEYEVAEITKAIQDLIVNNFLHYNDQNELTVYSLR